jgi:hypothetical protein
MHFFWKLCFEFSRNSIGITFQTLAQVFAKNLFCKSKPVYLTWKFFIEEDWVLYSCIFSREVKIAEIFGGTFVFDMSYMHMHPNRTYTDPASRTNYGLTI